MRENAETGDRGWANGMARFHLRRFRMVILAALGISLVAYSALDRLKLDTSLEALMPAGVESVENLHRVLEKTGSFASVMVVITADDPGTAARFAGDLRARVLAEFDWAASAEYGEDFSLFERHKLLYLETAELAALKERLAERTAGADSTLTRAFAGVPVNIRLRSEPLFAPVRAGDIEREISAITGKDAAAAGPATAGGNRRLFQSDDGAVTLLVVWPKPTHTGLGASKRIIRDLRAAVGGLAPASYGANLKAQIGGRIYNRVVQFDAVISDVSTSGVWSFSLIALLLVATFRSLVALVLIALPLLASILWTMALAALSIGGLNLVTVFLVLILFGLGVDFGIHNLARYSEARAAGRSKEQALATIFRRTGGASAVAALTTAAGFYALTVTDFRAFWEFGLIAGSGIILAFLAMYLLFPSLVVLAERAGLMPAGVGADAGTGQAGEGQAGEGSPLWAIALIRPRAALIIVGILLAAAALPASEATFENDFGRLQAERSPAHKAVQANISKVFPDGTDRAVLIVDTATEVRAVLAYLQAYMAADTDSPTIKKVESFYSYVPAPEVQAARLAIIGDIRDTVEAQGLAPPAGTPAARDWRRYLQIGGVAPGDLPAGLKRVFTGLPGSGGHLIYIFNAVSMNHADLARRFADDIRTIEVGGRSYHPATEALVFVDMLALMKGDAMLAILAVTAATILVLLLFFRSLRKTALVLLPPAVGLVLLFGIMGWTDIRLNIFNMVILPAIIGIGVDNGIHILHRLGEEGDLARTMRTTGRAAAITTLTTMLGFSGMLSASMGGLKSLGSVATLGFGACLFATFVALPPLLALGARGR